MSVDLSKAQKGDEVKFHCRGETVISRMSEFPAEAFPLRLLHKDASQWAGDGSYCLSTHPFDIVAIEPAFDWSTAEPGIGVRQPVEDARRLAGNGGRDEV